MPLVKLIVVVIFSIILTTNVFDNVIRKWFGLGKKIQRKKSFRQYEVWIELFILSTFLIISILIGIESPYIFIATLLFGIIFFGFEAILDKKYIKNSKEYLVTFLIGLLKSLVLMIQIVIYNFFSF
ncbi:hypothetical protein BACCIP111895_03261 [Neobacillus rhizosphaerae]|uniref:DUF4181 domain-containing protein n=1 Tax=Neobacillus rhizosphaerae TaxID=2880965 RepID=A0ABM9EVA8_9BACI|nr:DUF4181 domain-containing protein [Neobacillus rhizosphaerae]CAH2716077.1 hypothetical protein BACCIP111895_03261 [Neobacillus rhizosphaerae]